MRHEFPVESSRFPPSRYYRDHWFDKKPESEHQAQKMRDQFFSFFHSTLLIPRRAFEVRSLRYGRGTQTAVGRGTTVAYYDDAFRDVDKPTRGATVVVTEKQPGLRRRKKVVVKNVWFMKKVDDAVVYIQGKNPKKEESVVMNKSGRILYPY